MLKIYGSMICPDCVKCCQELKEAEIPFEYCDFGDSLLHLKEFLKLRDEIDNRAMIDQHTLRNAG